MADRTVRDARIAEVQRRFDTVFAEFPEKPEVDVY
jgi:hypothetical protein